MRKTKSFTICLSILAIPVAFYGFHKLHVHKVHANELFVAESVFNEFGRSAADFNDKEAKELHEKVLALEPMNDNEVKLKDSLMQLTSLAINAQEHPFSSLFSASGILLLLANASDYLYLDTGIRIDEKSNIPMDDD